MPDVARELVGESGFPFDGRTPDRLLQAKGVSNTVFKVSPPHSGCSAEVARKYHGVLVFTMRPAGESCAGSDYILLPSRGTLARAILRFWSGAITGLDCAGRKVFAADLANFLIAICWWRAG